MFSAATLFLFWTPRMSRSHKLLITALAASMPIGWLLSDDSARSAAPPTAAVTDQQEVDRWMEIKLHSAQEVFAGLTSGNFEQVQSNARRMQVFNILEQWSTRRGEYRRRSDYEGELNAFEYATKELVREARQKDTEGTLKAYVDLSRSCVRCHELVRDVAQSP
jgi:hypothetical protein